MFDPSSACEIMVTCMILHKYCMDRSFLSTVATDVRKMLQEEMN